MKQNLCLIGLLVSSQTGFSMETPKNLEQQKKLRVLISYFNSAEAFELMGERSRALGLYDHIKNAIQHLPESPELTNLKQKTERQIELLTKKSN